MIDIVKDLNPLGLKVYQQGTVPKQEIPQSYITVWNGSSIDNLNADNTTKYVEYDFTVIYYTTDLGSLYTQTEAIISLLKANGYVIDGHGFDIESGVEEYSARCVEVTKIDKLGG